MGQDKSDGTRAYKHEKEAVQRPDAGVEAQFSNKKPAKTYRYDSSLAPELVWDESAERAFAEWLLGLVSEAAEKGEAVVFAQPQEWAGNGERFASLSQCVARLKSLTKPFLNWTGKAERQQINVPTLPLFVHERHSTQAILETLKSHKALGTNLDLFGDVDLDAADRLDAYEHKGPWTNRLVLGDSLQVMNSLLEYEGMGGQVQMVYFDPPYGVKFGSNFQPFVRKNSVKHGADEEMIREPEMVKAYRDTWELGLHSYLTYLRDRLLLARELLAESGSIFVQISDENLHHMREVLDEVFGEKNFISLITFAKAGGGLASTSRIAARVDYIIWYSKNAALAKYHPLFERRSSPFEEGFDLLHLADGSIRRVTPDERNGAVPVPDGARPFGSVTFSKPGPGAKYDVDLNGKNYNSGRRWWGIPKESLLKVIGLKRTHTTENEIRFIKYFTDFPFRTLSNLWDKLGGAASPIYVVQTSPEVIKRCMLLTTQPGDLVLDISCGSGTTAFVAEQWGRRWITVDTSRVPIALARQRLLTSVFPWYKLKEHAKGPAGGFVYERKQNRKGEEVGGLVPRVTLKSIANDEPPEMVTLVDRPEVADKIVRVCGPFTVEATIQAAMSLDEKAGNTVPAPAASARSYLDRMMEVLRQSKTLRLPGNVTLQLDGVRPLADREYLHAEGIAKNGSEKRIAIVFGPEDGAIGSEYVLNASMEAMQQGFQQLFLFGFAIQAKAREMLDKLKIPSTYVAVTPDVIMSDLLKTSKASEIFSITGLPDVAVRSVGTRDDGAPLFEVEIKGLDIFRPDTMETDEVAAENLPCWMLDSNYNGMAFMATQVFFPKTSAWDNLQKSLKGQFKDEVWSHLAGTVSEPFVAGDKKRIAVKAIDERGNELMVVKAIEGAKG